MDIMNTNMRGIAPAKTTVRLPDIVGLGGAVAGLGAGVAMAIVAAGIAGASGDMWAEVKQIAAPLFPGFDPSVPGFAAGPVIVGTIIHLFLSALLGAVFGILKRRVFNLPSDMGVPVLAGLIYGFAIWLVSYFLVLPIVNPFLLEMYQPAFIAQHLVFGIVLGLLYSMVRPAPYLSNPTMRRREQE